jgi:hypothetical protein
MRIDNWQRFSMADQSCHFEKKNSLSFPAKIERKVNSSRGSDVFYFEDEMASPPQNLTVVHENKKIKTSKGKYNNNRACCQENGD